ncbi:hypothetical protein DPMN_102630 [Dreissena polymorpha]|uniref:Fibronectin type-III domain-containing protein n=1 Tax=Dreissena polymorpha TaxID=45954 RepID=A0A9D4LJD0_DREPO|nr:hypothetical protein DPMN_102630 [Dreissena polymorpha]
MVINATENDDVHLVCEFDSDPVANIYILNGTRILKRGHNNTLVATISHARCEYDAAVYSCQGGNIHSNSTGMQERVLQVFVKCAPRISPFSPPVTNISRTINGFVVLTFTIKAYPPPNRAAYSWYRLNDSAWITIIDVYTANISISADGLQTNMSISRLQSADFGRYRVSVYNDLGNATQEYELRAHYKPEPPKNLNVKEGSLNVDSFTVEWEPGFNGGEEQTFYIQYKPMESTLQWTDVNVSSNSWKYTLLGLQSGTTYFIKMFARNIVGISDETDVVTATTLVGFANSPSTLTSVAIGAAIGGIVCFTLSVVGVFCWKKRKPTKQKQVVMQYEDLIGDMKTP